MNRKEIISLIFLCVIIIGSIYYGLYHKYLKPVECVEEIETSKNRELDVYLISSLITSECANCSDKAKYLTAQTVTNRARIYKKDIIDIIFDKNQYYYKCNFYPANTEIAHDIISNVIPNEYKDTLVTHFYHSSAKYQHWMMQMEVVYFTDNLIIGYINGKTGNISN